MYKSTSPDIKQYNLDTALHRLHKKPAEKSDFGMDNTSDLIEDGFGIYSSANMKKSIGPVKTSYFRIGLIRSGSASFTCGLETFNPTRNSIIFGFPGQIFSLQDPSNDFFTYYMLFSESFISSTLLLKNYNNRFPFLSYAGIPCFPLIEEEAHEVESFIIKINEEVKAAKANTAQAIRLYLQLIFITASRGYNRQLLSSPSAGENEATLFTRFLKLVSEHFLDVQKVADYARMLHVSADHLNRTIKSNSDKTALQLIDEMILREAKAHLLHSKLSVAEIAYKLGFSDPSHFNKFFRKLTSNTPLQYRNKSE